jgi:hypothetical protein
MCFGATLHLIEKKYGEEGRTVNGEDGKLLRLTKHFVGRIYFAKVRSVPIKARRQRRRQQTLAFIVSDKFLKK